MKRMTPKHPVARIAVFGIALFLALGAVFLAAAYWAETSAVDAQRQQVLSAQNSLVESERSTISGKIEHLSDDLIFIRDSLEINGFDSGDYDDVTANWIAFADSQRTYDQIRFIDINGDEVIRVNYSAEGSYAVSADKLQNKADRYYFTEAIGIGPDRVYVSKLDLNVEGTQIEQPIKPMIRLCVPYYDATGTLRGIVCLNYLANDTLDAIDNVASSGTGDVYLLNSDGYWLYNEDDPDTAWAFMYSDRSDISFANSFPAEWERMKNGGDGEDITDDGLFSYTDILTDRAYINGHDGYSLVLDEGDWTVVSHVAPDGAYAEQLEWSASEILANLVTRNMVVLILLVIVALLVAFIIERNLVKKAQLRHFSEIDAMTGALNRRAGLERLGKVASRRREDDGCLCVCFIDVDGLKHVNDAIGHEAGDELILIVVDAIRRNVRDRDFLIRMGGDEFLVVFDGLNVPGAEKAWQRIADRFEDINAKGEHRFAVSASHGVAEVTAGMPLDTAIEQADDLMYEEKRATKAQAGGGQ